MALPHKCFTSVSFQTSTYRQSYTLKLQSIAKLQICQSGRTTETHNRLTK